MKKYGVQDNPHLNLMFNNHENGSQLTFETLFLPI
jgi:hypothetical protein